jgi:hypothetical protein
VSKQSNIMQQFHALRSALISEREAIQKRLNELNTVLGAGEAPKAVVSPVSTPVLNRRGRPPGQKNRVVANTMSLQQAVLKVLTSTPVTKQALLDAVRKIGYRFASSNPMNSLQTFLYGTGKKLVKKVDGKFATVGASSPAVASKAGGAEPSKSKVAAPAVAKAPAAKTGKVKK